MVIALVTALLAGCTSDAPCPDGSMAEGPSGLIVTEVEHPTGYGYDACFECHALDTLHEAGCTSWVDPVALRSEVEATVESQGVTACATCHGDNGVTP